MRYFQLLPIFFLLMKTSATKKEECEIVNGIQTLITMHIYFLKIFILKYLKMNVTFIIMKGTGVFSYDLNELN